MSDLDLAGWTRLARGLTPRGELYLDGCFEPAVGGGTFDSMNPATEQAVTLVADGGEVDIDRAVASARLAFDSGSWSRRPPSERKAVMVRLAELMLQHGEELALLDSLDMGKLISDAFTVDVPGAAAVIQFYGEAVDKVYGEVAPTGPGALALVGREPMGVVGAVVPWNFPLDLATWKLGPALAVGNSVVLKPAEQSPLSALRLAELATEAGLPAGVFNVVTGGPAAGEALGMHGDVDCLLFTGSSEVGGRFLEYAGRSNLKHVALECGGKSPNLVFDDVTDLAVAADAACLGIFFNQGQVCSANSRLLVQESIADELTERIVSRARTIRPGNPLDPESTMGAIVSNAQLERVMQMIDRGRAEAELISGGDQVRVDGRGFFVEPTVFCGAPADASINREEIFGPVLSITRFRDEEEAVGLANDSSYGLAASLWTSNLDRVIRIAPQLEVGTVSVNTVDALSPYTPFGGRRMTGSGRDLSLHALDNVSFLKTTWIRYSAAP
ncbi:MAG: aldehyde dehydrogenase [Solirubrobacterales bacterium]